MAIRNNRPKINDFIFRELIKRGYSLKGNTRIWNVADSKLWYLTPEQAQAYLYLEDSKSYQKEIIQKEIDLINNNISELIKKFGKGNLNILDIGCGDGKKAILFIKHLKEKLKLRYCPIDISSYMVEKAIKKIKEANLGEVVEFQWNISDFENIENVSILLRQGNFKRNLILLLGNTLGNFEINELLYEIRSSMNNGDFLLIGNGLDNRNTEEILNSYNTSEVNNFLIHIPLQLGLLKEDIEFGTRFVNSRVELYYTIKKAKTIKFCDKKVIFNKGDQILVSVSYKYNKEDFTSFLNLYFNEVTTKVSDDKSYALALCKK
ncbi:MAG: L-histidine N(alpha)-methyltransferase [Nanoarchaeota archaeon]|nr:L-histidine N(alpha)-methyltransferase [Nanoarchaeota archaeon]